jgi:hypothetical protein
MTMQAKAHPVSQKYTVVKIIEYPFEVSLLAKSRTHTHTQTHAFWTPLPLHAANDAVPCSWLVLPTGQTTTQLYESIARPVDQQARPRFYVHSTLLRFHWRYPPKYDIVRIMSTYL